MATLPSQDSYTAGVAVTAPVLNKNIRDAINFLMGPPRAELTRSVSWTVASNSVPRLITEWDTEVTDNDGMWNPTPTPSRITAQTPGLYEVKLFVHWPPALNGSTGIAMAGIQMNGNGGTWGAAPESRIVEDVRAINNNAAPNYGTSTEVIVEQYLSAGDYVEFYCGQSSGSSATMGAQKFNVFCACRWVASG